MLAHAKQEQEEKEEKEATGMAGKLKALMKRYGKIAIVTHVCPVVALLLWQCPTLTSQIALSATAYSGFFLAIKIGCPIEHLMGWYVHAL